MNNDGNAVRDERLQGKMHAKDGRIADGVVAGGLEGAGGGAGNGRFGSFLVKIPGPNVRIMQKKE